MRCIIELKPEFHISWRIQAAKTPTLLTLLCVKTNKRTKKTFNNKICKKTTTPKHLHLNIACERVQEKTDYKFGTFV